MNLSFRPCSLLLLSLLKVATSQDLLWSFTSDDAEERRAAAGVIEHGGFVYVAMNEGYIQDPGTYNESYLYQLTLGGEIVKRVPVGTNRDKVGMISLHGTDGIVVAPATVDGNYSGGLRRFSVPDLTLDWAVPEISIGERGCPPLVSSTGTVITGYGGGQLAATSATEKSSGLSVSASPGALYCPTMNLPSTSPKIHSEMIILTPRIPSWHSTW